MTLDCPDHKMMRRSFRAKAQAAMRTIIIKMKFLTRYFSVKGINQQGKLVILQKVFRKLLRKASSRLWENEDKF